MKRSMIGIIAVMCISIGLLTITVLPKCLAQKAAVIPKKNQTGTVSASPVAKTDSNPAGLKPNELGQVMILEYHLIGYPEAQWRRTPDNFRKDLQMLYDNGYYPVPLEDYVHGAMKVPAGKSPFVLTFDDSSQGQFRYLKKGDELVVDPDCALGIMERFKKEHPDFPLTATFFVLPEIPKGLRLFGQEEYRGQKLNYLAQHGYEIGNHSYWHQNLGKTDDLGVQKQLALAIKEIQSFVPGYQVRSLALPLGVHAKNRVLEHDGEFDNIKYHHESVLLVGSGSAPSPYQEGFDPYKLERIQAGDTPWGPATYVKMFKQQPSLRYVSDGDPATVAIPKKLQPKLGKNVATRFKIDLVANSEQGV